jgi:transcriptional/translational regulatory protein YebC/TACO1
LDAYGLTEDELLEKLLDYSVEDVIIIDSIASVICAIEDLEKVKKGVMQEALKVEDTDIEWVAKNKIELRESEQEAKAYKFLEALEEIDDVQNVYANLV